jgi:hypothetical protein
MADHSSPNKINVGGPAFPVMPPADERGAPVSCYPYPDSGMSLREWYAGQALAGLCANSNSNVIAARLGMSAPDVRRVIAHTSYLMADAMLEMRLHDDEKTATDFADAIIDAINGRTA